MDELLVRQMPHSPEAEQAVLGSMLIDAECVKAYAEKCGNVVTVEEHSVIGGLGDAVADVLMGHVVCKFRKIGVNDQFGQSGKAADVLREYGLTADQIAEKIKQTL